VKIAENHNVHPERLVDAYVEALKNGMAYCESIKVTCREVNHDSVTLLLTQDAKVIWQAPVNRESILNPNNKASLQWYRRDISS
jgi:hypothetical protein